MADDQKQNTPTVLSKDGKSVTINGRVISLTEDVWQQFAEASQSTRMANDIVAFAKSHGNAMVIERSTSDTSSHRYQLRVKFPTPIVKVGGRQMGGMIWIMCKKNLYTDEQELAQLKADYPNATVNVSEYTKPLPKPKKA